jgi:YgiT-type zinc finger domain-containing protein
MKCVICKTGETQPGHVTITLERDALTLVIKGVPAEVCANCGEEYVDDKTSRSLLHTAEEAAQSGVRFAVRDYVTAA